MTPDQTRPPLTQERIDEMRRFARLYGSANCWTGTLGDAAKMIFELLQEREASQSGSNL